MTPFVLIIVFNSFSTGGIVSTQDFNSEATCISAMERILSLDLKNFKTAMCVPK